MYNHQHIPSLDCTFDSSIMSCMKSIPSELSCVDAAYKHRHQTMVKYAQHRLIECMINLQ